MRGQGSLRETTENTQPIEGSDCRSEPAPPREKWNSKHGLNPEAQEFVSQGKGKGYVITLRDAIELISQGLLNDGGITFEPEDRKRLLQHIINQFITQTQKPNPFVAQALIEAGLVEERSELFANIAKVFNCPPDQRTLEGLKKHIKKHIKKLLPKLARKPAQLDAATKEGGEPEAHQPEQAGRLIFLETQDAGGGVEGRGNGDKSKRVEKDPITKPARGWAGSVSKGKGSKGKGQGKGKGSKGKGSKGKGK